MLKEGVYVVDILYVKVYAEGLKPTRSLHLNLFAGGFCDAQNKVVALNTLCVNGLSHTNDFTQ